MDCEWNSKLRESIPTAVLEAIGALKRRHALKYTWVRYLRSNVQAGFFKDTHGTLMARLRNANILLSYDGECHPPSQMLVLPGQFSQDGEPLIPALYLKNRWYLHRRYNTSQDADVLMSLGVKEMDNEDFLQGLLGMQRDDFLQDQTDSWWENVCTALLLLRNRDELRDLRIVPLADGRWTSVSEGHAFFGSTTTDIPRDLGLRMVKNMNTVSSHYKLLHVLGVKDAKLPHVVDLITTLHRGTSVLQNSQTALVSHSRFLFKHRTELTRRKFTDNGGRICVVTSQNKIVPATEVYMDHPNHGSVPLSRCFAELGVHFIHSEYLASPDGNPEDQDAWIEWLQTAYGVRTSPKINDDGLSRELRAFVYSAPTQEVLLFLKEYWEEIWVRLKHSNGARTELRALTITASNGSRCPLETTYIARGTLTRFRDLPFLPVADPEDRGWDFLNELGVTTKVDGVLYLKELIRLSQKPLAPILDGVDPVLEMVRGYYQQLTVRYVDEGLSEMIRWASPCADFDRVSH